MEQNIKLHLTYDENLTLHEFAKIIESINRAINKINKDNGINTTKVNNYSPLIQGAEKGSIILEILTQFLVPISLSVIVEVIKERFKKDDQFDIDINYEKQDEDGKTQLNIKIKKNKI